MTEEEKIIDLQKIDPKKKHIWQGIGISREEFYEHADEIIASGSGSQADFLDKFQFKLKEVKEELEKNNYDVKETILALWKERGQTKVTIKECVYTLIFIGFALNSTAPPASNIYYIFLHPPNSHEPKEEKRRKDQLFYT